MPPAAGLQGKKPAIHLDGRSVLRMDGRICPVPIGARETGGNRAATEPDAGQGRPGFRAAGRSPHPS